MDYNKIKEAYEEVLDEAKGLSSKETLEFIKKMAGVDFKPFTKDDYQGFAGVESDDPHMGELDDNIVILDGDNIQIIKNPTDDENGETLPDEWTNYVIKKTN